MAGRHVAPALVPSGRLGRSVVIALGINAVMAWIVLIGLYTFIEGVWRGLGGRFAGQSLEAHWGQVEAARHLQGLAWLITAALFLVWVRRVYANAAAMSAIRIRLTPRWVVGLFLVPGVNLVWPFLLMREIWNASDPDADFASRRRTPVWLAWWWGLFVAATILDPGWWRLVEDTSTRFGLGWPSLQLVVAQVLEVAAAALGIVVVRRIGQREQERWADIDTEEAA